MGMNGSDFFNFLWSPYVSIRFPDHDFHGLPCRSPLAAPWSPLASLARSLTTRIAILHREDSDRALHRWGNCGELVASISFSLVLGTPGMP